jgi:hypothetical protein
MMNLKNVNKRFVIGVLMVFSGLTSLMVLGGASICDAIGVCFFGGVASAGALFIINND